MSAISWENVKEYFWKKHFNIIEKQKKNNNKTLLNEIVEK